MIVQITASDDTGNCDVDGLVLMNNTFPFVNVVVVVDV